MKPVNHDCDSQARAGLWIVIILGSMGIIALLGLLLLAYSKREPSPVVLTAFAGAIGAAMTGLPSLMARMSGQSEPTQNVNVVNEKDDPVPTVEGEKK